MAGRGKGEEGLKAAVSQSPRTRAKALWLRGEVQRDSFIERGEHQKAGAGPAFTGGIEE